MKFGVKKTRVLGLPDGEEIMPLAFFVLTQYRRVTDRRTDGQTDRHVAITITHATPKLAGVKMQLITVTMSKVLTKRRKGILECQ